MASPINVKTVTTCHHQTTTHGPARVQIEAVQTVPPSSITAPRMLRQVLLPPPAGGSGVSISAGQGCLHVVLYYSKAEDGDSGSIHAGWIKESLAGALSEKPLLAGRLDQDSFDVVSNDAGVRLVEARVGVTMAEFLHDCSPKSLSEPEAELVFWKDVDELDPQFSPLFYVQVTKFECGGYSFGISCSILLADILLEEGFLKRWADIHNNLLSINGVLEKPLFYLPNLKKEACPKVGKICNSNPSKDSGQTVIFNVTSVDRQADQYSLDKFSAVAMLCVEEAENKLGSQMAPELISMTFAREPINLVKIEKFSKHEWAIKPNLSLVDRIDCVSWDNFRANELEFRKGNRPVRVSHWIGSVASELVLGIPFSHGEQDASGLTMIIKSE